MVGPAFGAVAIVVAGTAVAAVTSGENFSASKEIIAKVSYGGTVLSVNCVPLADIGEQ
jgi:hypothetical protein